MTRMFCTVQIQGVSRLAGGWVSLWEYTYLYLHLLQLNSEAPCETESDPTFVYLINEVM